MGIALLPRFIPHGDDLARLAVTGADLRWPVSIATSAAHPPSATARALIAVITN